MGLLDDKVALVTGAGSGIGRASAIAFARAGARVVAADLDGDTALECARAIERAGGEALSVQCDVGDESAVERTVAAALERFGRLDAAHNNAGISDAPCDLTEFSLERWERMLRVNLTGAFLCIKHEVRAMLRNEREDHFRAAIVNTSSAAGLIPAPGQPHYTAAKHGLVGLTRWVADAYKQEGIRCNAILPGIVETAMLGSSLSAEARQALQSTMPGGEAGRPADQAAVAVWLCSREARFVSGQSLVVDGGGILH